MDKNEILRRAEAAYALLQRQSTNREKFELIRALVKGVNPRLDNALDSCSAALSNIEKLQEGDVIGLTAEHLPENTEDEKKRKKAILFFINTWKQLEGEVKRVKSEFENLEDQKSHQEQASSFAKIITKAKGPFGIVTIAAVILVGIFALTNVAPGNKDSIKTKEENGQVLSETAKIKVIIFEGKQIPLTEVRVGVGPECDREKHYHAVNPNGAQVLDGSNVADPGGCGYGKISEVSVMEVDQQ